MKKTTMPGSSRYVTFPPFGSFLVKKRKFYLEDPGIIWIWWTPLRSQRKNIPNSLPRWWNLCHIHIFPNLFGMKHLKQELFETTYTPAPMNRYWGPKMKVSNSSSNHHFSGTNYSSLDLLAPKKAPLFSHLCHHPQPRSIEKKKQPPTSARSTGPVLQGSKATATP